MALSSDTLARIESGELNHRRVGEVGMFEGYPDANLGFSGISGHVNTVKVKGKLKGFEQFSDFAIWSILPDGAPEHEAAFYTKVYF